MLRRSAEEGGNKKEGRKKEEHLKKGES